MSNLWIPHVKCLFHFTLSGVTNLTGIFWNAITYQSGNPMQESQQLEEEVFQLHPIFKYKLSLDVDPVSLLLENSIVESNLNQFESCCNCGVVYAICTNGNTFTFMNF